MQKKNDYSRWLEFFGAFVFFNIIVWGTLWGTGTLTCGYHMVDDHEILEWVYDMRYQNYSIWDVIVKILTYDLNIRYRPLYYIFRVLGAYFFGINMVAFSIVNGVEIVIAMLSLYYCGRIMGAARIHSGLFALIALVGYQAAVWWKLGPQESGGTMLFAVGLYLLLKWLKQGRKVYAISSLIIFFLMCNYKESYILLLPFIGLYVVYDVVKNEEKLPCISVIWNRLKGKVWYILCLAVIFICSILAVVLIVGFTTSYGGFRAEDALGIRGYLDVLDNSLKGDLKWYKLFTIVFVAVLLTFWEEFKKLWKEMLLLAVFLLPQLLLYAKTGIAERYMLPSTIGYAWFFVIVILKWKPLLGKRKMIYWAGLLLMLLANARGMIIEADYFRYRGESVTGMLEAVAEMSEEEDIKILSCFRPNEEANWTVYYWLMLHELDNLYFWTEGEQMINRVCDYNHSYDPNDTDIFEEYAFEEMDVVLMYNQNDRHYCYAPSLDVSDFEVIDIGSMTIWVRKGSVEIPHMPDVKNYIYG